MKRLIARTCAAALMFTGLASAAELRPEAIKTLEQLQTARAESAKQLEDCKNYTENVTLALSSPDAIAYHDPNLGGLNVITRKMVDSFIARIQLVYLVEPDAFRDMIPKLAEASGLPAAVAELGVESMLEGDETMTAKAVDMAMDGLRKHLAAEVGLAQKHAAQTRKYCDLFAERVKAYGAALDKREAELKGGGQTAWAGDTWTGFRGRSLYSIRMTEAGLAISWTTDGKPEGEYYDCKLSGAAMEVADCQWRQPGVGGTVHLTFVKQQNGDRITGKAFDGTDYWDVELWRDR